MKKIAIIGGGNLGTAMALGLIKSEFVVPNAITVTKRNTLTLVGLEAMGVKVSADNVQAVKNSDTIILAVKPFQIKEVLETIAPELSSNHILISVVTGISLEEMRSVIQKDIPLFRAMPNTAIAIQESITCISSINSSEDEKKYVNSLFSTLGKIALIDESDHIN